MAKKTPNNKKKTDKKGLEIAVAGILSAGVAGYYFLYGSKQAKQNRKNVKSWALRAKADVLEQLEKTEVISEKTFHDIIGKISKKYGEMKNVDPKELEKLGRELKGHWKNIERDVKKHARAAVKNGKN